MACWKPFFANITSFFQRGSHHDVSEDQSRRSPADSGSVDSYDEASSSALPSSGFHVKRKHEGEKTVDELWEELLGHVRECHPTVLDNLYFTLRMKTQNEHDVTAVKNVFRREIIITLEQIYISCYIPRMKRRKTAGVQAAPTETLRCRPRKHKRLGKVENTDETSQLSTNGKRDVRYTVEEYEQKYQILEKRFQDSLEENEDLQLKVSSLTNCVKLFMAENERLNEAKGREEARAVHARRNAEMSHLLSKHSLSMAQLKDRQLKKAEGSSRAVMKRVEELQQVQNEIRTLLDNATRQSELHTQESRDGRTPSRSPRRFNRLRMALTRLSRNGNASLGGARVQAERPIEQSAALERDKPLMPMGNEQFFRKEARRKINVGEDEHELRRKT